MVRSGTLEDIAKTHRQLGLWDYTMKIIKKWSDRQYTVLFEPRMNDY